MQHHLVKAYASEACPYITMMAHQLCRGIGCSTEPNLCLLFNYVATTGLSYSTALVHEQALAKILKNKVQAVKMI